MSLDFAAANIKCFLFFFLVLFHSLNIAFICNSDKLFEGLYDFFVIYIPVIHRNLAAFNATNGFNDNLFAFFQYMPVRVKIVDLAYLFEANAYDFCHILPPYDIFQDTALRSFVHTAVTIRF